MANLKTMQNVEAAKGLARSMGQPAAKDRIGLATAGLELLRQVEPQNGEREMVGRVANRLANALKPEYSGPQALEAASVATQLRSFAMGVKPSVETICNI